MSKKKKVEGRVVAGLAPAGAAKGRGSPEHGMYWILSK